MSAELLIVFGTRPSYIKLWPVWRALRDLGQEPMVICTGQHQELIRQHMGVLDMPVDLWLDVMQDSGCLTETLSLVIDRVGAALRGLRPRLVIVHGDTTSGLGAGLAAYHEGIDVAHIEAGLRSGNPFEPWPEEVNRIALDALASLLFAPTMLAGEQARQVNKVAPVHVVGNPVVDSVQAILARDRETGLPRYPVWPTRYVLLEVHRRESFGPCLDAMVRAVVSAAELEEVDVLWPAHPNPAVRLVASGITSPRLHILEPLAYDAFLRYAQAAQVIICDSGGLVEEGPSLGVPTLQLREYTERPEAVQAQCSWLVGRGPHQIEKLVGEAVRMADAWRASIRRRRNPFGDGQTGPRIARHVMEWLEMKACLSVN